MHKDDLSKYVREIPPKIDTSELKDIIQHHKHNLFLFIDENGKPTYYCLACGQENNGHEVKWKYTPEELGLA